ncbi:DUF3649 domain-containing protein [Novosphingobium sp. BL-52-GroH]|uniref:DUF3649 domain-containing protein n=1 Tax=Novosphingobium sp. BL-52-GroH TaxID=3349877 RepID=UPI00384E2BD4
MVVANHSHEGARHRGRSRVLPARSAGRAWLGLAVATLPLALLLWLLTTVG